MRAMGVGYGECGRRSRLLRGSALGLAIVLQATAVQAQDSGAVGAATTAPAEPETGAITEIVVTAERRATTAQRTAAAISVIGGEQLAQQGITDVNTLTDSIPGLDLTTATPSTNIVLRGVGAGGSSQFTTSSVQFNIFNVPLSRQHSAGAAFYDLERVELLKGPQGTLYGRNATVGALNLVPKRPTFELEGTLNATVGNYDTVNTSGGVSLPITDKLAARLAFATNHHRGYLSNGYNDANNQSARASLLFNASEDVNVLFFIDHFNNDSRGPSTIFRYVNPGQEFQFPNNPWFAYGPAGCGNVAICPTWANSAGNPAFVSPFDQLSVVDDDGYLKTKQTIYGAEANADLGFATLTVIPALVTTQVNFLNYGSGFNFTANEKTEQKSIEARLASDDESRLSWLFGGIYFREDQNADNANFEPFGYQLLRTPNLDTRSYGLFGEVKYRLTETLRLIGGLRYTNERKSIDGFTLSPGTATAANCPAPAVVATGPITSFGNLYPRGYCLIPNAGTYKKDNVSYKAGFEFDAGPRSLLYANVRSGFRSGGLNPGLAPNTYAPEKLIAYELGSKNRFFDNRLQANLELFYWDYKSQQIGVRQNLNPTGQAPKPVNVPGNLYGAEFDMAFSPTRADNFNVNLLWMQGKFDIYPQVVNSSGTIGGLVDFDRYSTPEWTITAGYSHSFTLGSGAKIIPGAQMHYESRTLLAPVGPAQQVAGDFRPAYAKFDLDLTFVSADGNWKITGFVDNVTDEAVIDVGTSNTVGRGIFFRPATNSVDARYSAIQPPRTYGVRMSVDF